MNVRGHTFVAVPGRQDEGIRALPRLPKRLSGQRPLDHFSGVHGFRPGIHRACADVRQVRLTQMLSYGLDRSYAASMFSSSTPLLPDLSRSGIVPEVFTFGNMQN